MKTSPHPIPGSHNDPREVSKKENVEIRHLPHIIFEIKYPLRHCGRLSIASQNHKCKTPYILFYCHVKPNRIHTIGETKRFCLIIIV